MVKSSKTLKTSEKSTRTVKKSASMKVTKHTASADKSGDVTSKKYTNMFAAYRAFWARGFTDWAGTSSRSEYWWTVLANALIIIFLAWLYVWTGAAITLGTISGGIVMLFMLAVAAIVLYGLVALIPSVSMIVRRLHDGGFSSWWILLYPASAIPYVGYVAGLVLLVMMLMPTRVDGNPYHKYNK